MGVLRDIPSSFQTKFESGSTCASYLITLFREDGVWVYLTDNSRDLVFNGVTYKSNPGMTISNFQSVSDLSPDSLEIQVPFDGTIVKREDFIAERYDDCTFSLFYIDREDTDNVFLLTGGIIGSIKIYDMYATIELLSYLDLLNYETGEETSPKCRYCLGDRYCTVDLNAYGAAGSVKEVIDNSHFTAYIHAIPIWNPTTKEWVLDNRQSDWEDDTKEWFTYGYILFSKAVKYQGVGEYLTGMGAVMNDSMENNNIKRSVRAYNYTSSTPTFVLSRPTPFTLVPGDGFFIMPGCDKSTDTCETKFNNLINFGGEPDLPTADLITSQSGPVQ